MVVQSSSTVYYPVPVPVSFHDLAAEKVINVLIDLIRLLLLYPVTRGLNPVGFDVLEVPK